MRKIGIISAVMAVMITSAPQVGASVWTGACVLDLTFHFNSLIRLTGTAPDYSIDVSPAADLDLTKSGSQACAITLDPLEPSRTTEVVAEDGSSTLWSCSSVLGSGSWDQGWRDGGGSSSPPSFLGSHTITGTWGEWVLTVSSPSLNVIGVANLTIAPEDAAKIDRCPLTGLASVTMTGVLVFQDP